MTFGDSTTNGIWRLTVAAHRNLPPSSLLTPLPHAASPHDKTLESHSHQTPDYTSGLSRRLLSYSDASSSTAADPDPPVSAVLYPPPLLNAAAARHRTAASHGACRATVGIRRISSRSPGLSRTLRVHYTALPPNWLLDTLAWSSDVRRRVAVRLAALRARINDTNGFSLPNQSGGNPPAVPFWCTPPLRIRLPRADDDINAHRDSMTWHLEAHDRCAPDSHLCRHDTRCAAPQLSAAAFPTRRSSCSTARSAPSSRYHAETGSSQPADATTPSQEAILLQLRLWCTPPPRPPTITVQPQRTGVAGHLGNPKCYCETVFLDARCPWANWTLPSIAPSRCSTREGPLTMSV